MLLSRKRPRISSVGSNTVLFLDTPSKAINEVVINLVHSILEEGLDPKIELLKEHNINFHDIDIYWVLYLNNYVDIDVYINNIETPKVCEFVVKHINNYSTIEKYVNCANCGTVGNTGFSLIFEIPIHVTIVCNLLKCLWVSYIDHLDPKNKKSHEVIEKLTKDYICNEENGKLEDRVSIFLCLCTIASQIYDITLMAGENNLGSGTTSSGLKLILKWQVMVLNAFTHGNLNDALNIGKHEIEHHACVGTLDSGQCGCMYRPYRMYAHRIKDPHFHQPLDSHCYQSGSNDGTGSGLQEKLRQLVNVLHPTVWALFTEETVTLLNSHMHCRYGSYGPNSDISMSMECQCLLLSICVTLVNRHIQQDSTNTDILSMNASKAKSRHRKIFGRVYSYLMEIVNKASKKADGVLGRYARYYNGLIVGSAPGTESINLSVPWIIPGYGHNAMVFLMARYHSLSAKHRVAFIASIVDDCLSLFYKSMDVICTHGLPSVVQCLEPYLSIMTEKSFTPNTNSNMSSDFVEQLCNDGSTFLTQLPNALDACRMCGNSIVLLCWTYEYFLNTPGGYNTDNSIVHPNSTSIPNSTPSSNPTITPLVSVLYDLIVNTIAISINPILEVELERNKQTQAIPVPDEAPPVECSAVNYLFDMFHIYLIGKCNPTYNVSGTNTNPNAGHSNSTAHVSTTNNSSFHPNTEYNCMFSEYCGRELYTVIRHLKLQLLDIEQSCSAGAGAGAGKDTQACQLCPDLPTKIGLSTAVAKYFWGIPTSGTTPGASASNSTSAVRGVCYGCGKSLIKYLLLSIHNKITNYCEPMHNQYLSIPAKQFNSAAKTDVRDTASALSLPVPIKPHFFVDKENRHHTSILVNDIVRWHSFVRENQTSQEFQMKRRICPDIVKYLGVDNEPNGALRGSVSKMRIPISTTEVENRIKCLLSCVYDLVLSQKNANTTPAVPGGDVRDAVDGFREMCVDVIQAILGYYQLNHSAPSTLSERRIICKYCESFIQWTGNMENMIGKHRLDPSNDPRNPSSVDDGIDLSSIASHVWLPRLVWRYSTRSYDMCSDVASTSIEEKQAFMKSSAFPYCRELVHRVLTICYQLLSAWDMPCDSSTNKSLNPTRIDPYMVSRCCVCVQNMFPSVVVAPVSGCVSDRSSNIHSRQSMSNTSVIDLVAVNGGDGDRSDVGHTSIANNIMLGLLMKLIDVGRFLKFNSASDPQTGLDSRIVHLHMVLNHLLSALPNFIDSRSNSRPGENAQGNGAPLCFVAYLWEYCCYCLDQAYPTLSPDPSRTQPKADSCDRDWNCCFRMNEGDISGSSAESWIANSNSVAMGLKSTAGAALVQLPLAPLSTVCQLLVACTTSNDPSVSPKPSNSLLLEGVLHILNRSLLERVHSASFTTRSRSEGRKFDMRCMISCSLFIYTLLVERDLTGPNTTSMNDSYKYDASKNQEELLLRRPTASISKEWVVLRSVYCFLWDSLTRWQGLLASNGDPQYMDAMIEMMEFQSNAEFSAMYDGTDIHFSNSDANTSVWNAQHQPKLIRNPRDKLKLLFWALDLECMSRKGSVVNSCLGIVWMMQYLSRIESRSGKINNDSNTRATNMNSSCLEGDSDFALWNDVLSDQIRLVLQIAADECVIPASFSDKWSCEEEEGVYDVVYQSLLKFIEVLVGDMFGSSRRGGSGSPCDAFDWSDTWLYHPTTAVATDMEWELEGVVEMLVKLLHFCTERSGSHSNVHNGADAVLYLSRKCYAACRNGNVGGEPYCSYWDANRNVVESRLYAVSILCRVLTKLSRTISWRDTLSLDTFTTTSAAVLERCDLLQKNLNEVCMTWLACVGDPHKFPGQFDVEKPHREVYQLCYYWECTTLRQTPLSTMSSANLPSAIEDMDWGLCTGDIRGLSGILQSLRRESDQLLETEVGQPLRCTDGLSICGGRDVLEMVLRYCEDIYKSKARSPSISVSDSFGKMKNICISESENALVKLQTSTCTVVPSLRLVIDVLIKVYTKLCFQSCPSRKANGVAGTSDGIVAGVRRQIPQEGRTLLALALLLHLAPGDTLQCSWYALYRAASYPTPLVCKSNKLLDFLYWNVSSMEEAGTTARSSIADLDRNRFIKKAKEAFGVFQATLKDSEEVSMFCIQQIQDYFNSK